MKRAFWQRPFGKIVFGALSLLFVGAGGAWFHVHGEQMFYRGFDQKKPHHQADRFVNLDQAQRPPSGSALPKLLRIAFGTAEQGKHPAETASAQHKAKQLHRKEDSVTWLGHAAFQIRLKEANLLADPMLGPRASPFSFVGPKRFQPPGLTFEEIGKVDMIILSHNHYDHYDRWSLASFPHRDTIDIFVPLGMKPSLEKLGYRRIHEMDWWEERNVRGLRVVCYPVQHFSGRGLTDRARSLWSGWGVFGQGIRIFFGGDTGYTSSFKEIGKKDGPFDLAFVPIGAYEPRELFRPIHMNPEEAVQASRDIRARKTIGMHWGTFALSLEPPLEPPKRFREAAAKAGYRLDDVWVMKVGETRLFSRTPATSQPALPRTP